MLEQESMWSEGIKSLAEELEMNKLFSQVEAAAKLGVSDRTLRSWLPYLRWIYYWRESELVQNGQFTRDGLIAMAQFQQSTRPIVMMFNPKTRKFMVDRSGKTKTKKQKPLNSVVDYASLVWVASGVYPNPEPFASEPTSPEVARVLSDQAAEAQDAQDIESEVIDGELEDDNVSTLLVFQTRSYAEELAQMADDVTTLVEDGKQSQMNLARSLRSRAVTEGEMLATIVTKAEVQSYQNARSKILEEAFGLVTPAATQVTQKEMKRQTKKV